MADPFISEIRMVAFNYPPRGWTFCEGAILPINQNQALFSLLGTTFGGNGQTTFALPDLRGRVPVHRGNQIALGQAGGATSHTLTAAEAPGPHTHTAAGTAQTANDDICAGRLLAGARIYQNPSGPGPQLTTLAPATISSGGGGQAHENRQPYLPVAFCIALVGVYPSRQ